MSPMSRVLRALRSVLVYCLLVVPSIRADDAMEEQRAFDWDLISLEQNNIRFNGSVLSGFHSVRSPGVSPHGAWKTGLGLLFSREELSAAAGSDVEPFDLDRLILNPKINYGFLDMFEVGAGLELNLANGSEVVTEADGSVSRQSETELGFSAVVAGLKWNFFNNYPFRLGASFDTRAALQPEEFGMLPASIFNFELDGDLAFTPNFSAVANLQLLTSDRNEIRDQGILDLAAAYAFSDAFRGMLFSTVQEDDQAEDPVFFFGLAGQYVHAQVHSFTFAIDFQLNDARREVRTDNQIDLELSYTFTF